MIETIFNNKSSYKDLGITVQSFNISPPSKKKIKVEVPFMNGSYDMSTVGSNGEIVYNDRIINVTYNLESKNRAALWNKYSSVLEWLMDTGQQQLIFSDMPDCYYLAEVEDAPDFELIVKQAGIMSVKFIAYCFKYSTNLIGNELWDPFNFDTDYLQDNNFIINNSGTITIYNPGRTVVPIINVTSNMTAILNNYTATFLQGDNKDYNFKLQNGANNVILTGSGTIMFKFRKELL